MAVASRGLLIVQMTVKLLSFAHDNVLQATYSLIADDDKETFHLKIGQKLWRKLDDDSLRTTVAVCRPID